MIVLDAVRAAILSDDPFDRMDALVRAELAGGRVVRAVFDDLRPLVDDVLDTPGLTAGGEEAFLGTLDALTGDCHPSQHYRDLPAGYTVTFPDREAERRGLGFLVGRFSGRVWSNGAHVVPRDALVALADQNIPFTFVGTAGSDAGAGR
jgi:hypothetical protein